MIQEGVQVVAPARLHFGLLSFGTPAARRFGGCGVMLSDPCVQMRIVSSTHFSVHGPCSHRVAHYARAWSQSTGCPLNCEITVESSIPEHVGLGAGTQLALAVAAGLFRLLMPDEPLVPLRLATSVGRGQRSAVGTYGFSLGGLICERGKFPHEPLGELVCRLAIPSSWRFVLIRPSGEQGRSGSSERDAFAQLPPVPLETTSQLLSILEQDLIPACQDADIDRLGSAIHAFGRLAGDCFAPCQGGAFANARIARLVETIRELGIPGVGQSSWGPTVFALVDSQQSAAQLVQRLCGDGAETHEDAHEYPSWEFTVSPANNVGANVTERVTVEET